MSIYADIVTNKLFAWIDEAAGDRLVDYTLSCRAEMFAVRSRGGEDPLSLLAAEIAYDRALIRLGAERGVEVDAAEFASPRTTRLFLEHQLYRVGVDLHALACRSRPEREPLRHTAHAVPAGEVRSGRRWGSIDGFGQINRCQGSL